MSINTPNSPETPANQVQKPGIITSFIEKIRNLLGSTLYSKTPQHNTTNHTEETLENKVQHVEETLENEVHHTRKTLEKRILDLENTEINTIIQATKNPEFFKIFNVFEPTIKVIIKGTEFIMSSPVLDNNNRLYALIFTKTNNGYQPRIAYFSESGGNWHVTPMIQEKGWISKGQKEFGLSYEKGTVVQTELGAILSASLKRETNLNVSNVLTSEKGKKLGLHNIESYGQELGKITHINGQNSSQILPHIAKKPGAVMREYGTFDNFIKGLDIKSAKKNRIIGHYT